MQNRNIYTEVNHFLADESFRDWVRLGQDQRAWEEWTLENPSRAKLVEEARIWLLAMNVPQEKTTTTDIAVALESTWQKIKQRESTKFKIRKPIQQLWNSSWFKSVAAILIMAFFVTWLYQNTSSSQFPSSYEKLTHKNSEELVEQTNNTRQSQMITLSDGSSVLLEPDGKLSYPKIFSKKFRKVYLSGEAFFEISKNKERPFLVYSNELITKVVGTSFRIKAYSNTPNVEVLVRTGKVKVRSNQLLAKVTPEMVLLPNQAVRYVRKKAILYKISDITSDVSLLPTSSTIEQFSFEFTDIPVSQIFKTIEQAYSVKIEYSQDKLKGCYLTTSLSDQPLPEKLKIICKSLGNNSRYEMNGNQITIISNGCY